MKIKETKPKFPGSKDMNPEILSEEGNGNITMKPLDEFLKKRANEEKPVTLKIARLTGIDVHLPILGLLKIMSLGLLLVIMFFNLYLNKDTFILKGLEDLYNLDNIIGTFYFYCFIYMAIGFLIAWVYNFILDLPIKIFKKEIIKKSNLIVLYIILLFFLFVGIHIYIILTNTYTGIILFFVFILLFPILFGVIGILIKSRILVGISIVGIICLTLLDLNSSEEIVSLIFFSVLVLVYIEITDSSVKFDSVYSELLPDRDEDDYLIFNNTLTNYLIFISTLVGLTTLITFLIFYSQTFLKPFIPVEFANSIEFNSPIFLIFILILISFIVLYGKRIIAKGTIKLYSK